MSLFTLFATVIIVDRNTPPIDAIKASFEITKNNFVPVILALLVIYAIVLVGALACGIGLIVAFPGRRAAPGVHLPEAHRRPGGAADPVVARGPVCPVSVQTGSRESLRRHDHVRKLRPIGLVRRKGKRDKSAATAAGRWLPAASPSVRWGLSRAVGRLRAGVVVRRADHRREQLRGVVHPCARLRHRQHPRVSVGCDRVVVLIAMQKIETVCTGDLGYGDYCATGKNGPSTVAWIIFSVCILIAIVFSLWNFVVRQGNTGSSIGKQMMKFKVVGEQTQQPIGVGKSFIRQIAHAIDGAICYIGFLFPLWDAQVQTIADKLMKTVWVPL